MRKHLIHYKGLVLNISYEVTPQELRNQGHPDSRLPDVPQEVEVYDVTVGEFDPEWVAELITKELNNERDSE